MYIHQGFGNCGQSSPHQQYLHGNSAWAAVTNTSHVTWFAKPSKIYSARLPLLVCLVFAIVQLTCTQVFEQCPVNIFGWVDE